MERAPVSCRNRFPRRYVSQTDFLSRPAYVAYSAPTVIPPGSTRGRHQAVRSDSRRYPSCSRCYNRAKDAVFRLVNEPSCSERGALRTQSAACDQAVVTFNSLSILTPVSRLRCSKTAKSYHLIKKRRLKKLHGVVNTKGRVHTS